MNRNLPTTYLWMSVIFLSSLSCEHLPKNETTGIQAPMAKKRPHSLEKHGHTRIDNYYWLNQREDPEVIDFLKAENAYTEKAVSSTKELREKIFEEIKGRIKQDDSTHPYFDNGYYYYRRFIEGGEYPIYARKKGSLEAEEEILLDGNKMAKGHDFFRIGRRAVHSNNKILAYSLDTQGRRIYNIKFKNIETGETLSDEISKVTGNMTWAEDEEGTLFYARQDPQTLRSYQIYRHKLGTPATDDVLVYEEKDDTFSVYVGKSKSKKFILIESYQTLSSESRFLPSNSPEQEPKVFQTRQRDHEYSVDHLGDRFFIRSNLNAKNFRLLSSSETKTSQDAWEEVLPHRKDVYFEDFELFDKFLVIEERKEGLINLQIRPTDGSEAHNLDFGEPAYLAGTSINRDPSSTVLRYHYTSLTTPVSLFDYDMIGRKKTLLKQEEVLGDFDPARYQTERVFATAKDGTKVPISLVYRKDLRKTGQNPCLLYAYGSYGISIDASFRSSRLSLLDRGFVFAIGHIRGGQELGRQWYEDGKLLKKKNTFTDFISCGEYLVEAGYANSKQIYAMGGSAGGLLMGAVINLRPDLFNGVVAHVPFVDVVTTMLDDSIPLTTSEYDEWGNPNVKEYYDYILSYSPYDNIEAKDYPNLLITTGLHDSQVQYWEPAKWVAKLRELKTDNNLLLLKTNMEAGHGGASGRFKRFEEIAFDYGFLLQLAGIQN